MAAALAPKEIEDGLIPISALQHFLFCPRQCALIHIERLWAENTLTAEGRLLHERVDAGGAENRPGVRIARGLQLRSLRLGVSGRADIVEFSGAPLRPFPVEYKRGRPKPHHADEVQLCAQAMALEEMFGVEIGQGALFYSAQRRRTAVAFDEGLRELTAEIARRTRAMFDSGRTPPPARIPGCRSCSLEDACQPERLERPPGVGRWLLAQFAHEGPPDSLAEP